MYVDFSQMSVDQCVSYVHYLIKSETNDEGASCDLFERLLEQLSCSITYHGQESHDHGRHDSDVSRDIMISTVDIFHEIILQRQECPNVVSVALDYLHLLPFPELLLQEIMAVVPLISNKRLVWDTFEHLKQLVLRTVSGGTSHAGRQNKLKRKIDASSSDSNSVQGNENCNEKLLLHAIRIMVELSPMLEDQKQRMNLLDAVDLVLTDSREHIDRDAGSTGNNSNGNSNNNGSLCDTVFVELCRSVLDHLPSALDVAEKLINSFLRQV